MGFKYSDTKINCPLFKRVVRTTKGQFIGIECEELNVNLGFNVAPVLRLETSEDLKDYTDIFCRDCFDTCPYYKAHRSMGGE